MNASTHSTMCTLLWFIHHVATYVYINDSHVMYVAVFVYRSNLLLLSGGSLAAANNCLCSSSYCKNTRTDFLYISIYAKLIFTTGM